MTFKGLSIKPIKELYKGALTTTNLLMKSGYSKLILFYLSPDVKINLNMQEIILRIANCCSSVSCLITISRYWKAKIIKRWWCKRLNFDWDNYFLSSVVIQELANFSESTGDNLIKTSKNGFTTYYYLHYQHLLLNYL